MYKLKTTSTSARFYSWIWETDITKFKNMCPYFWKYTLTIMFLPFILLRKLIINFIPENKKDMSKGMLKARRVIGEIFTPNRFWDILSKILKWAFFAIILAGIILIIIECIKSPIKALIILGVLVAYFGIIVLIFYLNDEHNLWSKIKYPFKLFGNMVYSLYKNICPLINWEKSFEYLN